MSRHQNGRQNIIKIVSDATGELADGFHFLCLPQLRFELLALGDVTHVQHHTRYVRVVKTVLADNFEVAPGSVQSVEPKFVRDSQFRVFESPFESAHRAGKILWMYKCKGVAAG